MAFTETVVDSSIVVKKLPQELTLALERDVFVRAPPVRRGA